MAIAYRTSHTITCVHVYDDAITEPTKPTASDLWVMAAGQPTECTRVKVRVLSGDETARVQDGGDDANKIACELGLVSIDGEAVEVAELVDAMKVAIAELVLVSSLVPFGRRLAALAKD